jgi:hypothetical protein
VTDWGRDRRAQPGPAAASGDSGAVAPPGHWHLEANLPVTRSHGDRHGRTETPTGAELVTLLGNVGKRPSESPWRTQRRTVCDGEGPARRSPGGLSGDSDTATRSEAGGNLKLAIEPSVTESWHGGRDHAA